MADWYDCIEEPIREVVKALRDNGINTFCSCGHEMWVQCETYHQTDDLNTIYNVLVGELNITNYEVIINNSVIDGKRRDVLQINLTKMEE